MNTARTFKGYAALSRAAPLLPFEYNPGPLGAEQVEIAVNYCGVCPADISMIEDDWGFSAFPLVPGHEVVGTIAAAGPQVKHLQVGQQVGLGWQSASCMFCHQCRSGEHNPCRQQERTIAHRHGNFVDRVRCNWTFALPLPETLTFKTSGPLFCAGITAFNARVQFGMKPSDRVGVIDTGGLGHLALQFLNKWGCDVYAFVSSDGKRGEALRLGAHHVMDSRDGASMTKIAGSLDLILLIVDVPLDWATIIDAVSPKGRLVLLGRVGAYSDRGGAAPCASANRREFAGRQPRHSGHGPRMDHLRSSKARYRIVMKNDI
jgi:alcohol/geraniol dehydrogenase (NADP+)